MPWYLNVENIASFVEQTGTDESVISGRDGFAWVLCSHAASNAQGKGSGVLAECCNTQKDRKSN